MLGMEQILDRHLEGDVMVGYRQFVPHLAAARLVLHIGAILADPADHSFGDHLLDVGRIELVLDG